MPRLYLYARVSKPEQAKSGDGIRRQKANRTRADRWAEENQFIVDGSTLADLGVSGYSGANATKGALAGFLKAVEDGTVTPGSALAMENLDRLSRRNPEAAVGLFLQLVNAGIILLVITEDGVRVYKKGMGMAGMFDAVITLCRAFDESETKSKRSRANWEKTRQAARETGRALHTTAYAWLRSSGGKYDLIPDRAKIVRDIFKMAGQGHGPRAIAKTLTENGVKPWGKIARHKKDGGEFKASKHSGAWSHVYVRKVLTSRATYGQCQPRKLVDGILVADGNPIPNYFPEVVSEDQFNHVQSVLSGRKCRMTGRPSASVGNLFGPLLRNATDGSSMYCVGNAGAYQLMSSAARSGKPGADHATFPYQLVENSVLSLLEELDAKAITPATGDADREDEVATNRQKLETLNWKLDELSKAMDAETDREKFKRLLDKQATYTEQKKAVAAELDRAKTAASHEASEGLGAAQSVLELLSKATDEDRPKLRANLRAAIRALVSDMAMTITPNGVSKHCPKDAGIEITFRSGATVFIDIHTHKQTSPVQCEITTAFRIEEMA